MSWVLLVLLTAQLDGATEGFLWYDPIFTSKQECIDWANNNPAKMFTTLNYYYTDWEIRDVYCVREDKLDDFKLEPYPEGTDT